ncbi:MAG: hypothetical protein QM758_17690 [Armatimonas sp.]
MRRLFFCTLALLAALAALAQAPEPGARQRFYTQLGLTKPQITKAEALQKKYMDLAYTKMAALRKKYGEEPKPDQQKQITQQMLQFQQEIQKKASAELRALLTPAQRKKLDTLEAAPRIKARPE